MSTIGDIRGLKVKTALKFTQQWEGGEVTYPPPPISDKGQESGYFVDVILIRLQKLPVVMDTGRVYLAGEQGATFSLLRRLYWEGPKRVN